MAIEEKKYYRNLHNNNEHKYTHTRAYLEMKAKLVYAHVHTHKYLHLYSMFPICILNSFDWNNNAMLWLLPLEFLNLVQCF